jgi:hypothetical protein
MQRAASCFALGFLALTTVACMDQAYNDRAMGEVEAARREAAREGRLQALEREHAMLMQQMGFMAATHARLALDPGREDERDKNLAVLSTQVASVAHMISSWREEERPQPIDAEARRAAEQTTAEDQAATVRKVQALIDAGKVKLTMRNGRIQVTPVRPIDATDPYQPPGAKPPTTPPPTTPPKRPIDRLGF